MLRLRLTLATVMLGLALTPSLGFAQGETRTHTVKRGDTLWDLAGTYLGDPFRWPEIYRRNTETVKDPHWIYPDQVLVISGDVAPTPGTPADVARDEQAPMPEADTIPMAQPAYVPPSMTIFNPDRFRVVRGERTSLLIRSPASAVREGDFLQAPFMWDANGVAGAGLLEATSAADGVGVTLSERPVQMYERVHVRMPAGAEGAVGDRLLLFRYGPQVRGRGRVVIPTGIVKLSAAAIAGRAEAVVLAKFEDVFLGHHVMPLDTLVLEPGIFPARVEFGLETSIAYLYGDPVLPPVGHQIIFAAGSAEGLVPGDQLTLQRSNGRDSRGVALPAEDVATAQVTRVTPWGASAIIIGQNDGGVATGMAARVTAKMP
jgi:hypothetical protein